MLVEGNNLTTIWHDTVDGLVKIIDQRLLPHELKIVDLNTLDEAKLAREAEIRYCSISMVTDYDCWHQDHESVNLEMILNTMRKNTEKSKKFIQSISNEYYKGIDFSEDKTRNILDTSIVTHRDSWDKAIEMKLTTILKRYKEVNS